MSKPKQRQPRMTIEVRREQVLDAALELLGAGGYSAVTMEAVARQAELAKPRVYAAYPGRGPLLVALLEREQQRITAALAAAMPAFEEATGFDAILIGAATNLLEAVAAQPGSWRPLILPTEDAPAEVRAHMAVAREFALGNLRALLEWGRTRRPGLANIDADIAAFSLLAMGEQAIRLVLTKPAEFPPERFGAFARSALDMLATPGPA